MRISFDGLIYLRMGLMPLAIWRCNRCPGSNDEPRQKLMIKLREWYFPSPYGRNTMGRPEDLEKLTLELCKTDWQQRFHASDAILSVAGDVDFAQLREEIDRHFGSWNGQAAGDVKVMPPPGQFHHEHQKSEQTHIGIAYPSVPETHHDYYTARLAVEILSGGMSGRLFYRRARETRFVLFRMGRVQQPERVGEYFWVCRHEQ